MTAKPNAFSWSLSFVPLSSTFLDWQHESISLFRDMDQKFVSSEEYTLLASRSKRRPLVQVREQSCSKALCPPVDKKESPWDQRCEIPYSPRVVHRVLRSASFCTSTCFLKDPWDFEDPEMTRNNGTISYYCNDEKDLTQVTVGRFSSTTLPQTPCYALWVIYPTCSSAAVLLNGRDRCKTEQWASVPAPCAKLHKLEKTYSFTYQSQRLQTTNLTIANKEL